VISGIIFAIRNGLRWRDAPRKYGPHKTIYNRFVRWSRLGMFNRIFAALAAEGGKPDQLMIDASHLKAYWTATSLQRRGAVPILLNNLSRCILINSRQIVHDFHGVNAG
jgi:transposase